MGTGAMKFLKSGVDLDLVNTSLFLQHITSPVAIPNIYDTKLNNTKSRVDTSISVISLNRFISGGRFGRP